MTNFGLNELFRSFSIPRVRNYLILAGFLALLVIGACTEAESAPTAESEPTAATTPTETTAADEQSTVTPTSVATSTPTVAPTVAATSTALPSTATPTSIPATPTSTAPPMVTTSPVPTEAALPTLTPPTPTIPPVPTATAEATPTTAPPVEEPTPELVIDQARAEAGSVVYSGNCAGCHSRGPNTVVGPGHQNVYETAKTRVPGLSPESYLTQSIVDPASFVVPGFSPIMPSFTFLTDEQVLALVDYLKTL